MIDLPRRRQKILTDHRKGRNKRMTDLPEGKQDTATTAMTKRKVLYYLRNLPLI